MLFSNTSNINPSLASNSDIQPFLKSLFFHTISKNKNKNEYFLQNTSWTLNFLYNAYFLHIYNRGTWMLGNAHLFQMFERAPLCETSNLLHRMQLNWYNGVIWHARLEIWKCVFSILEDRSFLYETLFKLFRHGKMGSSNVGRNFSSEKILEFFIKGDFNE